MTLEEMRDYIAAVPWRFAKTMPQNPHEYTLRKERLEREADFEAAVMFIREHGYKKKFGKTTYTYYDLDGWSYWTMGAPLDKTILINRAVQNPSHAGSTDPDGSEQSLRAPVPSRLGLLFAFLLLATPAVAAVTVSPPAGDNPTPAGWLLVKLGPLGVNQIRVRALGGPFQTALTPALFGHMNIYNNYAGQQFWASLDAPQFSLFHNDMSGWPLRESFGHDLAPEVALGFNQVTLLVGSFSPIATPYPLNGLRQFTIAATGGYTRSVTLAVGDPVAAPEPAGPRRASSDPGAGELGPAGQLQRLVLPFPLDM